MPVLIPVKYHHRCYPNGIQPELQEIAGHMDITSKGLIRIYNKKMHKFYREPL